MPIKKENASRYPKDWKQISARIRFVRAESRCECTGECGLHKGRRCEEKHNEPAKWAKGNVILTTAHLNHIPEDVRDENLKAMCNRCHLRMDKEHHAANSAKTRKDKKLIKSPELFK